MRNRARYVGVAVPVGIAALGWVAWAGAQGNGSDSSVAQAHQTVVNTICLSNIKQMTLGMLLYAQDWDETLPPMKTTVEAQNRLMPYVKNRSIFLCPATKKPYQFNAALQRKKVKAIKAPASTMLLRDPLPHADGTWAVGYLDGHAKREKHLPGNNKK